MDDDNRASGTRSESTDELVDSESQRLIAEQIRMRNIQENLQSALEHCPESFGNIVMLYVNCRVNGHPVKAFVDTGAQLTVMSAPCAERVDVIRLLDRRFGGVATGVGVTNILGRIHLVVVAIENDFIMTSVSVLEQNPVDMMLGLDVLKRHQCSIDLQKNVLRIGTTGTETYFLPESEVPSIVRRNVSESRGQCAVQ